MEIQLSKLYKTGRITVPFVQQQKNSVDCGIFALAFLVDFCVHGIEGLFDKVFDVNGMRNHLIRCIENNSFSEFPKIKGGPKSKRHRSTIYTIEMDCSACTLPNLYDDMVQCNQCDKWYHVCCTPIDQTITDSFAFNCDFCGH